MVKRKKKDYISKIFCGENVSFNQTMLVTDQIVRSVLSDLNLYCPQKSLGRAYQAMG